MAPTTQSHQQTTTNIQRQTETLATTNHSSDQVNECTSDDDTATESGGSQPESNAMETTQAPGTAMCQPFNMVATTCPVLAKAFAEVNALRPTDEKLHDFAKRLLEAAVIYNLSLRTTSEIAGDLASYADQVSSHLTIIMSDETITALDIAEAFSSALVIARGIAEKIKWMKEGYQELHEHLKKTSVLYAQHGGMLNIQHTAHVKVAKAKAAEASQQNERAKVALAANAVLTGFAVGFGGLPGAALASIAFGSANVAVNKGKSSERSAAKADQARQGAKAASDNKGVASRVCLSLSDITTHLGAFVVFWDGHMQDTQIKIKELYALQDESVPRGRLNKLMGTAAANGWQSFGQEMRRYRAAIGAVAVPGFLTEQ